MNFQMFNRMILILQDLWDTQSADVLLHVSKGIGCCGHSVSKDRIVELSETKLLQIVHFKKSRQPYLTAAFF